MSKISDFASNSIMGVVRKIVNHIVDNVDPQISDATDHLPARFSGTFNDSTRNLTMTIESQGASVENLVASVNIPAGGGGSDSWVAISNAPDFSKLKVGTQISIPSMGYYLTGYEFSNCLMTCIIKTTTYAAFVINGKLSSTVEDVPHPITTEYIAFSGTILSSNTSIVKASYIYPDSNTLKTSSSLEVAFTSMTNCFIKY